MASQCYVKIDKHVNVSTFGVNHSEKIKLIPGTFGKNCVINMKYKSYISLFDRHNQIWQTYRALTSRSKVWVMTAMSLLYKESWRISTAIVRWIHTLFMYWTPGLIAMAIKVQLHCITSPTLHWFTFDLLKEPYWLI